MISQKPLATCAFGWGRTLKLYQEYLDVDGKLYALHELMHMRVLYRRVVNISSLRLELQFQAQTLVLRGLCVNEAAEHLVAHLKCYCPRATITSLPSMKGRVELVSKEHDEAYARQQQEKQESERRESALAQETPKWLLGLAQDMQRLQTRKVQRTNSLYGNGDDGDATLEQLAQHLQADTLPSLTIPIPLRLAPGEQARYCIEATLSAEPLSDGSDESPSYTYPPKDQGTLILTNRRLVYMGRRGQRVLGYARILRVSRLRGAIALLTDVADMGSFSMNGDTPVSHAGHRTRREIFQVSRPLECALYLDHLLRQFYVQMATQHLAPEPVSEMSEMATQQAVSEDESRAYQWSLSTRATEKVASMKSMRADTHGITEDIDAHMIQRSLADIADLADIETRPLIAIRHMRISS